MVITASLQANLVQETSALNLEMLIRTLQRLSISGFEVVNDSSFRDFGLFVSDSINESALDGIGDNKITESDFLFGIVAPPGVSQMLIYELGKEDEATWEDLATLEMSLDGATEEGEILGNFKTYIVRFRDVNEVETPNYSRIFRVDVFPRDWFCSFTRKYRVLTR